MGIVRPVMESFPFAWAFFVPFIIIATFTILNLFIGIIVSTMQELSSIPDPKEPKQDFRELLGRMEEDLRQLREILDREHRLHAESPGEERSAGRSRQSAGESADG